MSEPEKCRRCASAALIVTPLNDGTEVVVCSTCGRRVRRVTPTPQPQPSADPWWGQ